MSKRAKKPAKKKLSRAAASRKNGELGGRTRDRLPDDVVARLGPPPTTSKELRTWNARLLAEVQWLAIRGEIAASLAATIRANATSIDRAMPNDAKPEEDELLDADMDDDEPAGPDLTEDTSGRDGIRVG